MGRLTRAEPALIVHGLSSVNGLRKGRSTARQTDPVLPVDETTIDATLPRLPLVVANIVRLQKLTGMRPTELCLLRPIDLDRSADVWVYKPLEHKTAHRGKERVVFIGPQAQDILLRYLARDSATYCFRPCDSEANRRATQRVNRRTPLSCGTKPSDRCKRNPKRTPGDRYTVASYRRAIAGAIPPYF